MVIDEEATYHGCDQRNVSPNIERPVRRARRCGLFTRGSSSLEPDGLVPGRLNRLHTGPAGLPNMRLTGR